MPRWSVRSRAFTLIELLVVIVIISLLMALLLPSLQAAKQEAQRVKCATNEKNFGNWAHQAANEDKQNRLHLPHPATNEDVDKSTGAGNADPEAYWMGSGDHCWGGDNGSVAREYGATTAPPPGRPDRGAGYQSPKGTWGRFMNKMYIGREVAKKKDYNVFKCTGDDRWPTEPIGIRPQEADKLSAYTTQGMFKATGNSYMGDTFWYKDHYWDTHGGGTYRRFGAYRRPTTRFPEIQKAVLFWETRFLIAMANTTEIGTAQIPGFGQQPRTVMGQHGKPGKFNVVFADGHVANVQLRKSGDMNRPADYNTNGNAWWKIYWRGPSWRYDNFPKGLSNMEAAFTMVSRSWFQPWPPSNYERALYNTGIGRP